MEGLAQLPFLLQTMIGAGVGLLVGGFISALMMGEITPPRWLLPVMVALLGPFAVWAIVTQPYRGPYQVVVYVACLALFVLYWGGRLLNRMRR